MGSGDDRVLEFPEGFLWGVAGSAHQIEGGNTNSEDDAERVVYLDATLRGVHRCMSEGIDVRGYFVWSLLDNFEWNMGFGPKLGLHAVDRMTFERTAKPSAGWYSAVARTNRLAPDLH